MIKTGRDFPLQVYSWLEENSTTVAGDWDQKSGQVFWLSQVMRRKWITVSLSWCHSPCLSVLTVYSCNSRSRILTDGWQLTTVTAAENRTVISADLAVPVQRGNSRSKTKSGAEIIDQLSADGNCFTFCFCRIGLQIFGRKVSNEGRIRYISIHFY